MSFVIKSNDGMKLLINDVEILSHDLIDSAREKAATIYLKSGINSFKVQYFNYRDAAELQIKWGRKGESMKDFSSEFVWHLENIPAKLLEYLATRKDSDADQLSDMDEMRYGTSYLNSDSDGDGLSDYAEIKVHFTNPNNADTNGNGPVLQTVSGVPEEENTFFEETRFEAKPSLWQRIKNSKFVRTIRFVMSIRVVLDYPALPEGRDN